MKLDPFRSRRRICLVLFQFENGGKAGKNNNNERNQMINLRKEAKQCGIRATEIFPRVDPDRVPL